MVKIKLFADWDINRLNSKANDFLASHRHSDIVDIQYRTTPHVTDIYSVCITYRDGS